MKKILILSLIVMMIVTGFTSCATGGGNKKKSSDVAVEKVEEEIEVISVEPEPVQEEVVETSNVDDTDPSNWLTALGSIKGLNVVKYRLRGEGPDGASFDWIDVKGPKVALSDVRRGEWTLYAEAIGEDGAVVATGSLTTFLSDSTPLGTLFLSEETGKGDVSCNFTWNNKQVLYPTIELYVKTVDGNFTPRDKSEIKINDDGTATWTAKNMKAGTYVVRAILKDEGEVVSGVAAALRVIDGKLSVGNCQFVIGKLSTVYGIDLSNAPLDTVEGTISMIDGVLSFNSEAEDLVYTWFLDGDILNGYTEKTVDVKALSLNKGFYRFDCVACNASGFTSINTVSSFVYVNGDNIFTVTSDEADSNVGDVPEGYEEISTIDEEPVEEDNGPAVENLMVEVKELIKSLPSETAERVIEEVQEDAKKTNMNELQTWRSLYERLKEEDEILNNAVAYMTSTIEKNEPQVEAQSESVEEEKTAEAQESVIGETLVFTPVVEQNVETVEETSANEPNVSDIVIFD